jgi:hypothetical protein
MSRKAEYQWKVGDVFTNGTYRWKVITIDGEKAVLQSCGSSWATTMPLTFDDWREGGRWQLIEKELADVP